VLVTRTSNVVGAGAVALVAGTKGELKPPARGVQGEEKTPCTTLCRPGWKRKRSVAPAEVVVMGVNGEAFWPTVMLCWKAKVLGARRTRMVSGVPVGSIVNCVGGSWRHRGVLVRFRGFEGGGEL